MEKISGSLDDMVKKMNINTIGQITAVSDESMLGFVCKAEETLINNVSGKTLQIAKYLSEEDIICIIVRPLGADIEDMIPFENSIIFNIKLSDENKKKLINVTNNQSSIIVKYFNNDSIEKSTLELLPSTLSKMNLKKELERAGIL